jgi:CheY-like chemotaxis protein
MRIAAIGLNRQIRLSVDASGVDDLEIEMDPGAFAQILLNLAVNARDAMPTGGTLRVEALTLEDGLSSVGPLAASIVVEDSGCGIPEQVLARVFEPFFTTKPRGVGTGLGLAVVRQATAAAHGRVSVESSVGRGTRFVIELPAFRAARSEKAVPGRRPLRVVLAEDHALLRSMLADALRADGHEVADCSDGAMALELALRSELPPDVLILEAGLPSKGGFEVLAEAEARAGRAFPAVLLTADPTVKIPGDAPRRVELMFKPFEVQSLFEAVARVVRATAE